MRIWLEFTEEIIEEDIGPEVRKLNTQEGVKFYTGYDRGDPLDLFFEILSIPQEVIVGFSCWDNINAGFRPDGIYRLDSAVLTVITMTSGGYGPDSPLRYYQRLKARADSLEDIREIWLQVRTGELDPEKDFTKDSVQLSEPLVPPLPDE